jgi:hypothetical protein
MEDANADGTEKKKSKHESPSFKARHSSSSSLIFDHQCERFV